MEFDDATSQFRSDFEDSSEWFGHSGLEGYVEFAPAVGRWSQGELVVDLTITDLPSDGSLMEQLAERAPIHGLTLDLDDPVDLSGLGRIAGLQQLALFSETQIHPDTDFSGFPQLNRVYLADQDTALSSRLLRATRPRTVGIDGFAGRLSALDLSSVVELEVSGRKTIHYDVSAEAAPELTIVSFTRCGILRVDTRLAVLDRAVTYFEVRRLDPIFPTD